MSEYFPVIPITKTIAEKIAIHFFRISNNYFYNKELNEIDDSFDIQYVKPLTKMTPSKYKEHKEKNKDLAAKIKKIVWVINSNEEYASDFKNKVTRNEFTSIAAAYKEAQVIYSKYCPAYQSAKAVITTVNGVKRVKRKQTESEQESESLVKSTLNDYESFITKETLFQALKDMLHQLRDISSLRNDQLKHLLSLDTDANSFLSSIDDYSPPSTHQQRVGDYILTQLYEKFSNISN